MSFELRKLIQRTSDAARKRLVLRKAEPAAGPERGRLGRIDGWPGMRVIQGDLEEGAAEQSAEAAESFEHDHGDAAAPMSEAKRGAKLPVVSTVTEPESVGWVDGDLDDAAAPAVTGLESWLVESLEPAQSAELRRWSFAALSGRLVEISAHSSSATLSTAFDLVLEAQLAAEPVAWIMLHHATFYPPDVASCGVDLAALMVVSVTDAVGASYVAEQLARSGGFGLVVLDFCSGEDRVVELPIEHQGRLVKLAQTYHVAVVCVTEKPAETPSLGSLISLRAEGMRLIDREHDYEVKLRVLKDKRQGPGWSHIHKMHGPAGY